MVLELVAVRLLVPAFGNTTYLWTNVLGVTLLALSGGYYLGGRLADRQPVMRTVSSTIVLSGLFVALVPVLFPLVRAFIGEASHGPMGGPLLTVVLLFFGPAALVGAISPMAVKLVSAAGAPVGKAAGLVSMFTALGSIVGTFATGFFLVPLAGSYKILAGVATALTVLGGIGLVLGRDRLTRAQVTLLVLAAASCVLSTIGGTDVAPGVLFDEETPYQRVLVYDGVQEHSLSGQRIRFLMLDTTLHGAMVLEGDRDALPLAYTRAIDLLELFVPDAHAAAFVGGGTYTMPKRFLHGFTERRAEVYELDPVIVAVGQRFFGTRGLEGLVHRVGDARQLLRGSDRRFDLIFGDAYHSGRQVPFHLTTVEYYRIVKERLRLGGIYMTNIVSAATGPRSGFFRSTLRTLQNVFPEVYVFAAGSDLRIPINLILVCPQVARGYSVSEIRERGRGTVMEPLTSAIVDPTHYVSAVDAAPVLTDDYGPVESIAIAQ